MEQGHNEEVVGIVNTQRKGFEELAKPLRLSGVKSNISKAFDEKLDKEKPASICQNNEWLDHV